MNERIGKLLSRSGGEFYEGFLGSPNTIKFSEEELGTFVELIVRECIAQASISNGHGNNQWDKALTFAADNIKEHFGVRE